MATAISLVALSVPASAWSDPPAGLVAAYAFDEGSGGVVNDASGNGHSGTVSGATWTAGRNGGGLSFNGTDASVLLGSLGTFYNGGFTLEAWVRKQTSKNDVAVVGTWTGSGGPMLWVDHLATRYHLTIGSSSLSDYLDSGHNPILGQWQHVAATYDGTTARFYIDGAQVASRNVVGSFGSSNSWRVGAYGSTPGGFFDGLIDNVRVYSRALAAGEIQTNMNQPVEPPPGPPADTAPPTAPGTLTATGGAAGASLNWGAATDNVGVTRYNVHRSTTSGFTPSAANRIAQPPGTSYTDAGLSTGTYHYKVIAEDAAGNIGAASNQASATVDNPGVSPAGLRVAYGFDDGAGTVALDSSGNNRTATLVGAGWTTNGRFGGAVSLSGQASEVDPPALGTFYKTGFTYEAWVQKQTSKNDVAVLGTWTGAGGPMIWVDHINGRYRLTLGSSFGNYLDSGRTPTVGQWQHVAATYDGAVARIYIDGVETASAPFTGNVGDSNTWRVGAFGSPAGGFFDGLVDNVRIYDRALSASEIAVNMASRIQPEANPPTVTAQSPSSGAGGVNVGSAATATFSEPMNASTITGSTFLLKNASGASVPASVTYTSATNTAKLTPQSALQYSVTYTLTVKGGSSGVKDLSGNALASDVTWSFSTEARSPVLVVTSAGERFSSYLAEILRNEGLNGFITADVSLLTSSFLSGFDVVVLGNVALTNARASALTSWVNAGGNLLAMRPDTKLAALLGLTKVSGTWSNAYLKVNTSAAPGAGIVGSTVQFHGTADRYLLSGATAVATLYSTATAATANPAVTLRSVGASGGQAAAFTYDLARSVVYTRQGNPAWAGQERDGILGIRPNDMFYGAKVGDVRPDWVNTSKIAIPQADEQQRLLVNLITLMARDKLPLPHFWYLPRGEKAAVVMSGDDHSPSFTPGGTASHFDRYKTLSPSGCSVAQWECVRSTSYLFPDSTLTNAQAAGYLGDGFEVGLHPLVSPCPSSSMSAAELGAVFDTQLSAFQGRYTSLPAPTTSRTHCVYWPDWATKPQVELARGIRLDGNYYHYPESWIGDKPGFMNGGGFPMRFAELDGTPIDVYQQNTNLTDESTPAFEATINALLDNALGSQGYYGAFGANMHTDHQAPHAGAEAIVASAQARGVPVISYKQLLTWVDGRSSSTIQGLSWSGGTLTFTASVGAGASGLQTMLPVQGPSGTLTAITHSGSSGRLLRPDGQGHPIRDVRTPSPARTWRRTHSARVRAWVGALAASVSAAVALTASGAAVAAPVPAGFQETVVFSGLTAPTSVRFVPDGRVFVAEKSGLIKVFDGLTDSSPTVFADLSTKVHNFWDRGLLGLALDPQFTSGRPYVYVLYAHDAAIGSLAPRWGTPGVLSDPCPTPPGPTGDGCIVSGRLSRLTANGNIAVPNSESVLIEDWCQQYPSHSIGSLAFGADGALYVSGGDGASFNFADWGQDGNPLNPCGDPPGGVGATLTPPSAEGGALRSQDLRTMTDPVSLDGSVLRVDPNTGAGMPDNPLAFSSDPNAKRIVAHGLRNPFRFTIRPRTSEVWVGDVGWSAWEEINRLGPLSTVRNFGWPCYEGNGRQGGYDGANLSICENLYAQAGAVTAPFFTYAHSAKVVLGETCPSGGSSISGLAFYDGGTYPASYDGALFFSDYSRSCIWVMFADANGLPDPSTRATFVAGAAGPVALEIGPGGDLFYVDLNTGTIRRITFLSTNRAPTAVISASPTNGPAPLTVSFDGTGSSDPDGDALSYAWDLDGDGAFDDSTAASPTWVYPAGTVTARLRVTDPSDAAGTASVVINSGNTPPAATISAPAPSLQWRVGDTITFSGSATDPQEGALPASRLNWTLDMRHCSDPDTCHTHNVQNFTGVSSGSFTAPDHEYPSHLLLTLTASDSQGATDVKTVRLDPRTVDLTFTSQPSGLQLAVGSSSSATPFTRTVIVGSVNSVSAPSPQTLGGASYRFASWSDGGAATHTIVAPSAAATYAATFDAAGPSGLAAAYSTDAGAGTTVADVSGNGNIGTISGATWTSTGKYGGALSFDGVNDWVTVADASSLDLTTGMTLEAWVRPTVSTGWRTVILKEQPGQLVYALYAGTDTNRPSGNVFLGGDLDTRGTAALPANAWSHLAATYDGTTLRLFVNGAPVSSRTVTGAMVGSAGALRIGGNGVWGEWFQGLIDELRVYNRALSVAEIQSDMSTPVGAPTPPDTQPPTAPIGLTAQGGLTSATLNWTPSTDNVGIHHYDVHRGTSAGFTPSSANRIAQPTAATYTDTPAAGAYFYKVIAYDAAGNFSAPSNQATATVGDTAAPSAPTNLAAAGGVSTANLNWTASTDNAGVHHYDVHRSTVAAFLPVAGNRVAQVGAPATTYADPGLAAGVYFYKVVAYDAAGNSSAPSNEASASITGDTTPPTVALTAPVNGATVSATVNVAANAADNVGVVGVQFKVDGQNIGAEDTTSPYSVSWNTTGATNGPHDLTAVARDAVGHTTTSSVVRVTVDNTTPPTAGLVASYSFNAGTGTTLADTSGNGNNGTISGATWSTSGKYGGALSFDGVNDLVTVADANSLDLTTGMTLEAWVFPAALGGTWRTALLKEQPGQLVYGLYANADNSRPSAHVFVGGDRDTRGTAILPINTWTHLAAAYDGATLRLYVNGVQASSQSIVGSILTSTGALRIGGNNVWAEWFSGRLDEVRVYNRALSAAEVQADLNRAITP